MDRSAPVQYSRTVPPSSLVLVLAAASLVSSACKSVVASSDECSEVADHLGALQVKKEKLPPMGRLASPPFNGPENERAIHDEARDSAKARCLKGWKREVFDCMQQVQTIEEADRCRLK
jgi:hypothetical protein